MLKIIRRFLAMLLLLAGISMLAWGLIPGKQESMQKTLLPDGMRLVVSSQAGSPALLEVRRVRLEWPTTMRIGDSAEIWLVFEPAAGEVLAPTPMPELTDAYADYNLMVESRLEAVGMQVQPADPRRESLPAGQVTRQVWLIKMQAAGSFTGTVWLSLRFLPLDGGQAQQVPIFVHELRIQATSLFGLSGGVARLLGGVMLIIGLGLSYDIMLSLVRKWKNKKDTKDTKDSKEELLA